MQVSWADGVNDLLKNASWPMESKRYWKARRVGTPNRGTEDMATPNWDEVVARALVAKYAKTTDSDVFRLQLFFFFFFFGKCFKDVSHSTVEAATLYQ